VAVVGVSQVSQPFRTPDLSVFILADTDEPYEDDFDDEDEDDEDEEDEDDDEDEGEVWQVCGGSSR
jgi:hypothetical protein